MRKLISLFCVALTAGCGGAGSFSTPFDAQIIVPKADGSIDEGLLFPRGTQRRSQVTSNAVSYELGISPDNGIRAFAGVVPGATLTAVLLRGSATYEGGFSLSAAEVISGSSNEVRAGNRFARSGAIDLTVNFVSRTVSGLSDRRVVNTQNGPLEYPRLSVSGLFAGQTLTGNVVYEGTRGELSGVIGGNEILGAFVGKSSDLIYAGGIVANPDD